MKWRERGKIEGNKEEEELEGRKERSNGRTKEGTKETRKEV